MQKNHGVFMHNVEITIFQSEADQAEAKMTGNFAHKFNDESSSDFRVKCKDTIFHVHQWILANRSEYFSMIFRNDCLEMQNKELIIEDFKPNVVRAFLQYIYSGTLNLPSFKDSSLFIVRYISDMMQIADKYNSITLMNTCDSYIAQWYACLLRIGTKYFKQNALEILVKLGVKNSDKLHAKKWAAAI